MLPKPLEVLTVHTMKLEVRREVPGSGDSVGRFGWTKNDEVWSKDLQPPTWKVASKFDTVLLTGFEQKFGPVSFQCLTAAMRTLTPLPANDKSEELLNFDPSGLCTSCSLGSFLSAALII